MTFHFLKTSSGTPAAWVDGTDLPALETLIGNYWTSTKIYYPSFLHSDQYRWYRDGPAFYELRATPAPARYVPLPTGNPAIRVTEVDVAGTGSGNVMPPQMAISVTEKTSSRLHWGRWYLPAPCVTGPLDASGRLPSTNVDALTGFAVTLYNACRAASYIPVVWSIQKPVRLKRNGSELPEQVARAYEVNSIQMDDLYDVIRRRRYSSPTYRKVTTLT